MNYCHSTGLSRIQMRMKNHTEITFSLDWTGAATRLTFRQECFMELKQLLPTLVMLSMMRITFKIGIISTARSSTWCARQVEEAGRVTLVSRHWALIVYARFTCSLGWSCFSGHQCCLVFKSFPR